MRITIRLTPDGRPYFDIAHNGEVIATGLPKARLEQIHHALNAIRDNRYTYEHLAPQPDGTHHWRIVKEPPGISLAYSTPQRSLAEAVKTMTLVRDYIATAPIVTAI